MPTPDLHGLYEERNGARSFRIRNAAYRIFELTYNSDDGGERPILDLAYRPNNVDGVSIGQDSEIRKIVINQVRRVVSHFTSMFSHRPRVFSVPESEQDIHRANDESDYIEHVARVSNLDAAHVQQSHYLALRGDAVFGVDWNTVEG